MRRRARPAGAGARKFAPPRWHRGCLLIRQADTMSLKTVQFIVGRLVTDEDYRLRFLEDPSGTLGALRDQGVDLTRGEIDALVRTDRRFWTDAAERIDPDLQRSSLRRD
jgi:hypothetical protein